jgi:hypothetical protein
MSNNFDPNDPAQEYAPPGRIGYPGGPGFAASAPIQVAASAVSAASARAVAAA